MEHVRRREIQNGRKEEEECEITLSASFCCTEQVPSRPSPPPSNAQPRGEIKVSGDDGKKGAEPSFPVPAIAKNATGERGSGWTTRGMAKRSFPQPFIFLSDTASTYTRNILQHSGLL